MLFKLSLIVSLERRVPLLLESAHLGLDRRLVDTLHIVMLVCLDAQGFAQRRQQMFLVHLRKALDRVVLDVLGDVPELLDRLEFQVVIAIRGHGHLVHCFRAALKNSTTARVKGSLYS